MNPKKEFLQLINSEYSVNLKLKGAWIRYGDGCFWYGGNVVHLRLEPNYTDNDYIEFLNKLDVEYGYGSGYGVRILGTIKFTDGTWCGCDEDDYGLWWWGKDKISET